MLSDGRREHLHSASTLVWGVLPSTSVANPWIDGVATTAIQPRQCTLCCASPYAREWRWRSVRTTLGTLAGAAGHDAQAASAGCSPGERLCDKGTPQGSKDSSPRICGYMRENHDPQIEIPPPKRPVRVNSDPWHAPPGCPLCLATRTWLESGELSASCQIRKFRSVRSFSRLIEELIGGSIADLPVDKAPKRPAFRAAITHGDPTDVSPLVFFLVQGNSTPKLHS